MISARLAYVLVVVFAATLHSSGVVVSAMENSNTVLIGNPDAGLDSDVQRRLRGAVEQDATDEERGLPTPIATSTGADISSFAKLKRFAPKEMSRLWKKAGLTQKFKDFFAWLSKLPKTARDKVMKILKRDPENNKKAGDGKTTSPPKETDDLKKVNDDGGKEVDVTATRKDAEEVDVTATTKDVKEEGLPVVAGGVNPGPNPGNEVKGVSKLDTITE